MQTLSIKPPSPDNDGEPEQDPGRGLFPLLAGAAMAVAGVGAVLASFDSGSPLRAPCALFFLLAAPAMAIGAALPGLRPWPRTVVSLAGAVAIDLLVAQGMLAVHRWSVTGGILSVAAISSLLLLLVRVRRPRGRTARRRA
ncbi:hypothetical protein ACIHAA_12405 [Streptomyces sp. NPDC052040]|uniref:hypothetical protein n=1 Tax=unclassified Streptomyces TaxID=2593676 RepID=UPI0037D3B2F8